MLEINVKTLEYEVDLRLRHEKTLVCGESSTGKSMLFNIIKNYETVNKTGRFICINADNIINGDYTGIVSVLKKAQDNIILIDHGNHILDIDEISEAVYKDVDRNNYYIIMGRSILIGNTMCDIAEPFVTENRIELEYLFEE